MERAGKALAKLKLSEAISPEQLAFAAWTAAVGERIARHAWPKALVRGALRVEAEDWMWQQQLFQLRPHILAKIAELVGAGVVTDLTFSTAGRTADSVPRRPPQPAPSHGATHGEIASADEADRIKDPGMRIVYRQARNAALRKTKKASA